MAPVGQTLLHAIDNKGNINMNECFYCLDCQSLYYNNYKCPPLVIKRKKLKALQSKNVKLEERLV